MYRQFINFYIDKNNNLQCIWYAKRKGTHIFHGLRHGNTHYGSWHGLGPRDEKYAVRRCRVDYNCDKYGIGKVGYYMTEDLARHNLIRKLNRSTNVTQTTLQDRHLKQLAHAPRKYVEWFFAWLKEKLGDEACNNVSSRFYKVIQAEQ